ncbi:MAG: V-type ATPase 116kDa subunit family protein [Desulfurococcaceae archaeon]
MSKPIPMKKIYVISSKEHSDKVTSLLQNAGVVHIIQSEQAEIIEEYELLIKIREEILNLLNKIKGTRIVAELMAIEASSLTIEKIKSDIGSLVAKVNEIESQISRLKDEHERLLLFSKVLSKIPLDLDPHMIYYEGKRISSVLLIGRKEAIENLKKIIFIKSFSEYVLDEETSALLAYLESRDLGKLIESAKSNNIIYSSEMLKKYIYASKNIEELRTAILSYLAEVEDSISSLRENLEKIIKENAWLLGKYLLLVDNYIQKYNALASVRDLKHLTILVGWVPATSVNQLKSKLDESGIPLYVEIRDPDPGDKPPTLMRNPPVIRFYQLVTKLYGVPGYFERDPTPIIAYSFALFFGLMNADFGYALIGILAALYVLNKMVDDPESPYFKEFKGMILASNTVALILGVLSGSIFGDVLQRLLKLNFPVILSSILNPLDFIKLSLIIGLVHINISHVLTTIKLIKERRKGDILIELGLFVTQIFGIPYILRLFLNYTVPFIGALPLETLLSGTLFGIGLVISGCLATMRLLGTFMWIFQITGLLGDVLSYVRLAGVGLATYYMALIFNFILELMANSLAQVSPLASMISVVPLAILAHLMVAILSQLGAFVHSMRLCILEFLSKFYEGTGYEYNPFKVVNRAVLITK